MHQLPTLRALPCYCHRLRPTAKALVKCHHHPANDHSAAHPALEAPDWVFDSHSDYPQLHQGKNDQKHDPPQADGRNPNHNPGTPSHDESQLHETKREAHLSSKLLTAPSWPLLACAPNAQPEVLEERKAQMTCLHANAAAPTESPVAASLPATHSPGT